ncbi:MAG: aminopeptidase P N-terminal domain-containing protein [Erysipelotrichaceae bacterium]|nr:aminopeptidase P N-terminal domain-containing protein [Erysipelotrichaceae bacterium]
MLPATFYKETRKRLAETMKDNSFYFCHSGVEVESTHDETFRFEPYRNFLYLTGLERPNAILLITKQNGNVDEVLFMHIPTEREQRWTGVTFHVEELRQQTGIQRIQGLETWEDVISRMMFKGFVQDAYMDMARWRMSYARNKEQQLAHELQDAYPYLQMHNAYPTVCKMRTIKQKPEIEAHRRACKITEAGVKNMLRNMKPGMMEYEIEAYYDFELKRNGVRTPAFWTIAAAGKNACIMHYMDNNNPTKDGDMILFDLGAQSDWYCADVSRTYPVNGKFTERQKQLYNVVLKGLEVAESLSKPGQKKNELQLISKQVMAEELVKIGKIEKPEEIDKYYFHGSGHYIGLDTHDVGDTDDTILAEDMMFTLEPGLYFDDEEIGIRIEDTILITKDGCEVLSGGIPKTVEDIEAYMAKGE